MTKFIRKHGFETVEMDGEWLILNAQEYTVTALNEVGGYCWQLLQEQKTVQEIIEAVELHYTAGRESVQQDIEFFLADLVKCGLVQHAG